jgi:hypothetical protein
MIRPFDPWMNSIPQQLPVTVYTNSESWKEPVEVLPAVPGRNQIYTELAALMK